MFSLLLVRHVRTFLSAAEVVNCSLAMNPFCVVFKIWALVYKLQISNLEHSFKLTGNITL